MNFMNRAWLYVIRKKGKSILLSIILLFIATFVLTALAIGNASETAQQNLRQGLGGNFLIATDYSDINPYLKVEELEGGTITYSTQQITPKLVAQIREMDGVKNCSATAESLEEFPSLSLFAGTVPIEEEFRLSAKIFGVWNSDEITLFTSDQAALTEGRHLSPDDKNKGIISKDLAERNHLKVGDIIQTGNGVALKIVGLFTPKEIESKTDLVTSYDKIQNLVLCDLSTLIALENGPAIQGFGELTVSVDDPQNMENIISAIREIPDVDWNGFSITADSENYEKASFSMRQLSGLVSAILIVILVVSTAVLSLILTMWSRTRIHETGVLLSVGIRKLSIIGQYITEVLMIAVIAFSLSYFTASAAANQVGAFLQKEQLGSNKQDEDDALSSGVRGEAIASNNILEEPKTQVPDLQVSIQWEDMVLMFLIGIGIAAVSAGFSSISVMRLNPREILSKMS